jgi:hypothetical protein
MIALGRKRVQDMAKRKREKTFLKYAGSVEGTFD